MAAVSGFHYAFAGFDVEKLAALDYVILVNDEPTIAKMILHDRAKIGVASEAYLNWLSVSQPQKYKELVINPKEDHRYNRQFIVIPGSPLSASQLNGILTSERTRGALAKTFAKYGLPPPPLQ